ncbi:hypothetical protein GGR56DRAFT_617978 [Xylariaceae sp. FL0804]|nr:hypothetical protein GGR56DRAFT_617978 [Xylariaceae sp. FL0804]
MYRSALRSSPRIASSLRRPAVTVAGRRFASTSPADKKRTWKSSVTRLGLAVGAVYWYTTSVAFAEEPEVTTVPPPAQFSDEDLPTVEAVVAQKRREAEARLQKAAASEATPAPAKDADASGQPPPEQGSPEALEEEADQQGAFNPETGEINWDCPCLGGMAHGPCGEEFKAAFSCFVYSKEEPKGMDCIDKFQGMQDCFRKHPEIYGEELDEDEEAEAAAAASEDTPEPTAEISPAKTAAEPTTTTTTKPKTSDRETGESLPSRIYDATGDNGPPPGPDKS